MKLFKQNNKRKCIARHEVNTKSASKEIYKYLCKVSQRWMTDSGGLCLSCYCSKFVSCQLGEKTRRACLGLTTRYPAVVSKKCNERQPKFNFPIAVIKKYISIKKDSPSIYYSGLIFVLYFSFPTIFIKFRDVQALKCISRDKNRDKNCRVYIIVTAYFQFIYLCSQSG